MNYIYKLFLLLLIFNTNVLFAQKNLKLVVYKVEAIGGSCKSGSEDFYWSWEDGVGGTVSDQCYGNDNVDAPYTQNITKVLFDNTYNCASDWPTGTINYTFYWAECNTCGCLAGRLTGSDGNRTESLSYPSSSLSGNGPDIAVQTTTNTWCGSVVLKYFIRWEATNSFIPIPEDAICSAENRGTIALNNNTTSPSADNTCAGVSGNDPDIAADNESNTTWHYFETPTAASNTVPTRIDVSIKNDGVSPVVRVFKAPSKACPATPNTMPAVTGGEDPLTGDANVGFDCPEANSRYYIMVDGDNDNDRTGDYRVQITSNGSFYQAHDMIANAVTITPSGSAGSTVSAANSNNFCCGEEPGEVEATVNCSNITTDNTIWYKFQAPAAPRNRVILTTDNGTRSFDTEMQLWWSANGSGNFAQFSEVGCNDDKSGINYASEIDADCLIPGAWYYVQIDGHNGSSGTVRLDIRTENASSSPPSNDNICSATNLNTTNSNPSLDRNETLTQNSLTTFCATPQSGEPNNPITTVWHQFTTGSTIGTNIRVLADASSGLDAYLGVYKGCPGLCPATDFSKLSEIGEDNNLTCLRLFVTCDAEVNFIPEPNTTYYAQVDRITAGNGGPFNLSVQMNNVVPTNDHFCVADANALYDFGTVTKGTTTAEKTGSTVGASIEESCIDEPRVSGNDRSVWYKFITPANGATLSTTYKIYIDGSGNGDDITPIFNVYEYTGVGTGTPATTHANCGASFNFQSLSHILEQGSLTGLANDIDGTFCANASKTYYIQVTGYDINEQGIFKIKIEGINNPSNDLICNAKNLTPTTQYTYNSANLLTETNIKGSNCNEPQPNWIPETCQDNDAGVWYKFGQVPGRTIVVDGNSLAGDNISLQYALYSTTTNDCNAAKTLVQVENNITSSDEDAYFTCLDPALFYWMLVDGGDYDFTCLGIAAALEEGNFSLKAWFPEEAETTACSAENLGTIPATGSLTVKNLSNICGVSSITNFPAPSTWGFDKAVVYRFTTPPAGAFTDASIKIEAFTNPYYDETTYSGAGGGAGGNMDMLENAFNSGDDIDLQLAVYSAGNCSIGHTPIASNYDPTTGSGADITGASGSDESIIVNCLLPSTEYFLVVDGGTNTSGFYDIKMSNYNIHTTNDFLYQAIDITGTYTSPWTDCNSNTPVTLTGQNNYCATNNNDMPSYLPAPFRPSSWNELNSVVWYKFKAPKSGKLEIRAKNSIPDLITPFDEPEISLALAVFFLPGGYQGALDASTLVANKNRLVLIGDDFQDPAGLAHDEDFTIECLMPDSIYYLAVDGYKGSLGCPTCDRGEFYLELQADPRDRSAPNDFICDAIDLGTPAVWTNPTIYDTRVNPATNPTGVNGSPTSGYASGTGLHNGPRTSALSCCMRVENNFCAGIANEPAMTSGTFFSSFSPDATVWYKFTAPTTGEVKINTYNDPNSRGDQIYTQIAVFETSDNTCTGTMINVGVDGVPDVSGDNELIVKCLDPGKTYFLMVDGAGININGYFEMQVQAVPATLSGPVNDDICAVGVPTIGYPTSIGATTTHSGTATNTNRCANIQSGVYPNPTTFSTDADVWYTFTTPNTVAPHAVKVTVNSGLPWPFGDAMDPQIALYKRIGTCPTATFELVDDGYSALGLPFTETFNFHCLEQNTTYYLMVDGSGLNEQGNFNITLERIAPHPLPTNDDICQVGTTPANGYLGVLGGATGNKIGNTVTNWHNFCSDVETNEATLMTDAAFGLDQTVWFHFKTPATGGNRDIEIRALNDPNNVGDQIDLQMLLVQGNPTCPSSATTFNSLTPIESSDNVATFNSTINPNYAIGFRKG
jgi:hypothetical protein